MPVNPKIPISVCIIAKNEEKYIEECLKRLKECGFEIIVTDTGSTDNTRKIAQKYADKVLDFEWINDFSAARNYCAQNASNDWILALDCDEHLTSVSPKGLKSCIKEYYTQTGLLHLTSIVSGSNGDKNVVCDDIPRLYNRKFYKYKDAVHEQLAPKNRKTLPCFTAPIEAVHYGYDLPPDQMRIKQERNLSILYDQLNKYGETPYLCFQIAQSENILEDYKSAVKYYEKSLSYDQPRSLAYVQYLIEGLAKCYICLGRKDEALFLMNRYEEECKSARYIFYHANILLDNNEPLKALIKYVKVTTLPDVTPECDELMYSYRHIIEIYHKLGEYDLAKFFEDKYAECLEARSRLG